MGNPFPFCFGCGAENPIGLKLQVACEGDSAWAEFTPNLYHSGFDGVVHGGLLCTLLDEVMSYLPYLQGRRALTAKFEARFRRTVRPGENLKIKAWVTKKRDKLYEIEGSLSNEQGEVVAEATSLHYILGRGDWKEP